MIFHLLKTPAFLWYVFFFHSRMDFLRPKGSLSEEDGAAAVSELLQVHVHLYVLGLHTD